MRPSPDEVHARFAGVLADEALAAHLGVLCADPNWRVAAHRIADTLTLQLLYYPTGELVGATLRCVDVLWWPLP